MSDYISAQNSNGSPDPRTGIDDSPLIPTRMLMNLSLDCRYRESLWPLKDFQLEPEYRLVSLSAIDGNREFADFRIAWNASGLVFSVAVTGRKEPPRCDPNRPDSGEAVQLFIDTRDVHSVHRATRYCHRFAFLPTGAGENKKKAAAVWLPINRARAHPTPVPAGSVAVAVSIADNEYKIAGRLDAAALTGFDPDQFPRLGFNYAIVDHRQGVQTLAVGSPMPTEEDPSLWASLTLVGGNVGE